jgi:hypothetical protein
VKFSGKRSKVLAIAALYVLGAAIYAAGQETSGLPKQNVRTSAANKPSDVPRAATEPTSYAYEFRQPDFVTNHIAIEHNESGKGKITFHRRDAVEPITDPIEISQTAWSRIGDLWESLRFLDSTENYQSEKQFPHMGTMTLLMKRGTRERKVELNWTNNRVAAALLAEYRRIADQAIFVFDISLSRENQPLNSPRLLDQLESDITRGNLSDPRQVLSLLRELTNDERLPLIARNHAARLIKKIEKTSPTVRP